MFVKQIFHNVYTRRGFGIHSPYVFRLVTEIIGGKLPFYAFSVIAQLVSRMDAKHKAISAKRGQLIFRLINFSEVEQLLIEGKFAPDIALYMMMPKSTLNLYCKGEDEDFAFIPMQLKPHLKIKDSINLLDIPTFVYWRGGFDKDALDRIFTLVCTLAPNSVLLVEEAKQKIQGKSVFEHLEAMEQITISIQAKKLGIFIFKPKMSKKSYKAYY